MQSKPSYYEQANVDFEFFETQLKQNNWKHSLQTKINLANIYRFGKKVKSSDREESIEYVLYLDYDVLSEKSYRRVKCSKIRTTL